MLICSPNKVFDINQYILPIVTYAILLYIMTLYLLKGKDIKKMISIQEKYRTSSLGTSQQQAIMTQLSQLMQEEKLYTDSALTLKLVAAKMGIQPTYISQTISSKLQVNFNEWVNTMRVKEVCVSIQKDQNQLMTIEQHAYAAGFNSMSTFYSVFKKIKGMTPKEFRGAISLVDG